MLHHLGSIRRSFALNQGEGSEHQETFAAQGVGQAEHGEGYRRSFHEAPPRRLGVVGSNLVLDVAPRKRRGAGAVLMPITGGDEHCQVIPCAQLFLL